MAEYVTNEQLIDMFAALRDKDLKISKLEVLLLDKTESATHFKMLADSTQAKLDDVEHENRILHNQLSYRDSPRLSESKALLVDCCELIEKRVQSLMLDEWAKNVRRRLGYNFGSEFESKED